MTIPLFSYFHAETGILTTQQAPYIEDGWYIESHPDGQFKVFEIPQYGGGSCEQGEFTSFQLAYEFALALT
jgi:hypothetical protein